METEFWPDYGGQLLYGGGRWIDPAELLLHEDTKRVLLLWLAEYSDDKLSFEPTADPA
ncbi:MAG TPA: hypothetical protein VGJ53_20655 [Micromonosporaceae bacterium]